VDDAVDALERRPDRIEVGDVGDVAGELLRRQRERHELVPLCEVLPYRRADHAFGAGDEDAARAHVGSFPGT